MDLDSFSVVQERILTVVAGSYSTQLLPDLAYHLESSAGSIATFSIDKANKEVWDKYSPEKFPVITWKATPRSKSGKDTGSVYVLPRTPEGLVKIGYRGVKVSPIHPTYLMPADIFSTPTLYLLRKTRPTTKTASGLFRCRPVNAAPFRSPP